MPVSSLRAAVTWFVLLKHLSVGCRCEGFSRGLQGWPPREEARGCPMLDTAGYSGEADGYTAAQETVQPEQKDIPEETMVHRASTPEQRENRRGRSCSKKLLCTDHRLPRSRALWQQGGRPGSKVKSGVSGRNACLLLFLTTQIYFNWQSS